MFGTGLIVFRETLEAALFVGILAAATQGVAQRTRWLALGVALGVAGSLLLAGAMEQVSSWANGFGQDLVNLVVLSVALFMLAWHSIWVSAHAREMSAQAQRLGQDAALGEGTLWAVTVAVAMTVLREGAETVLFVTGLMSGNPEHPMALAMGTLSGLALGLLAGWLIYRGLGRVQPKRLFAITNVLLLLLAGSLASQLAKTLQQADWLAWLGDTAWDTSSLLSNDSLPGMLLHGVVGYDASPSLLQVLFYAATTLLIGLSARHIRMHPSGR
jgi:high-affinity iron transporter